jgi:hypothetical protein
VNGKYILDERGNPVLEPDLLTWAKWFETADRIVATTTVGEVKISTVFLSLDHAWGGGPPLLFETMVFGGALDQEQMRYSTRAEALAGHTEMVKRVDASDKNSTGAVPGERGPGG